MLTTIRGYYSKGEVTLNETPPFATKMEVLVTFLIEDNIVKNTSKGKLGGLEGLVNLPVDFNEPMDDLKDYM